MRRLERLDTNIDPEAKKLLMIAKARMGHRRLSDTIYWLARIYMELADKLHEDDPEELVKKIRWGSEGEALIVG